MQVAVLGPTVVRVDGQEVDLGGPRSRALVARLALEAGRPVSAAALIDDLWGEDVPGDATNALQSVVSRTRRRLPEGVLRSVAAGYVLHADVDAEEFTRLAASGRTTEALALWRGAPLADLREYPFAEQMSVRLDETRLETVEADLEKRLDEPGAAAELAELTRAHPYRDGLWLLRLTALVRAGRPTEALTAYQGMREMLADELGADPSQELQDLHASILRGEATRQRRPSSLPVALSSFVGRKAAIEDVREALAEHRLVTILGPGGSGKTRLSVESARAGGFEETWLVELAPVTGGEDIVPTVLSAMGLLEVSVLERPGGKPRQDLHTRLLEGVHDADGLLILDNCEHLIDEIAKVTDQVLARGPKLRVLATSREPLRIIGEFMYQLGPLSVPAESATVERAAACSAVQLFVERAHTADQDFALSRETLPAVREICTRLDGQPLAIELAAARLRTLSADQIAARLSDRFRLLTGGSRTSLPRHRTLRAVVEWSWDLLDSRERDLVERLAVFPGGVTAESAAAVFGDAPDTAELLESLADKSLLVPIRGAGRFRMLETLREYGVERLVERGIIEEVRTAHLDHFLAKAERLSTEMRDNRQVEAIAALDADRGNLTAALRFAIDREDRPRAARMVMYLAWYWSIRNQHLEVDSWSSAVLELPGEADPASEIAVSAVAIIGIIAIKKHRQWRPLADRILALWDEHHPTDSFTAVVMATMAYFELTGDRELPEPPDAWTRSTIGLMRLVLLENAGRVEEQRGEIDATIEGFRQTGDLWGVATSLGVRAQAEAYDGDFDRALATWDEALPLLEKLGADEDVAFSRMRVLALRLAKAGPADVAVFREELDAALDRAVRSGNGSAEAVARLGLGQLERMAGNYQASSAHLTYMLANLDSLQTFGGGQFESSVRASLAAAMAGSGDLAGARAELDRASKASLDTHDMPVISMVAGVSAYLAHASGDEELAATLLGAADTIRGRRDLSNTEALAMAAEIRAAIGDPAYDLAYRAGAELDREAAIAFAAQSS